MRIICPIFIDFLVNMETLFNLEGSYRRILGGNMATSRAHLSYFWVTLVRRQRLLAGIRLAMQGTNDKHIHPQPGVGKSELRGA